MKIHFEVLPAFLPLWEEQNIRYWILMGGRGAGRSTAASQYAVSQLPSQSYFRCAIMREIHSDIRHSIWSEINDRIDEQNIREALHITDNDMHIDYGRNSVQAHGFHASSGSRSAKLKSLASYSTVIIEEAEETSEPEFLKLDDTLRTLLGNIRIVFCLNPPPKNHWIINRFFNLKQSEEAPGFYKPELKPANDTKYLFGTYKDNILNLNPQTVQQYEHYRIIKPDYYWQMIAGLVPETVRGKIYKHWELIDDVPKEARLLGYAIDFGWFPDPACLLAIYYCDNRYIVDELAYGTELTNEVLSGYIDDKTVPVIADSAEPKSIDEIYRLGIKKIRGSAKGADSVDFGIKVVADKKIAVTKRSKKVWESYENYAWEENKDGEPTGEPTHKWSHAMDAIRYFLTSMKTDVGTGVRVITPNYSGYGKFDTVKKIGGGLKIIH